MSLVYLTDIIILLAAVVVSMPIARLIGLGTVPGFLVAGLVVGPSVFGLIDNPEEIRHLAELGVVLLQLSSASSTRPSTTTQHWSNGNGVPAGPSSTVTRGSLMC